jgi:homeodomain interacting protein kinase
MNVPIGNEQAMATDCLEQITKDGFNISSITTDPDSGACKAAEELHTHTKISKKPEHFLDTRHLSENQRKTICKLNFSKNMFPGRTQNDKNKMKKRFANDLVKRCESEFKAAQTMHAGDIRMLKRCLSYSKYSIVKCYQNDHSECRKHSFTCNGGKIKNWINISHFNLPNNFKLNCTEDDEYKLHQCVEYRLGPKTLEKTRLGMNTQKVESTNRTIRRSLPKNVTYTRNFEGRAHVAIHSSNNGPGLSMYKLCKKVGAPVTDGTKVTRSLLGLQKSREQQLAYHKSAVARSKRCQKRHVLYKLYDDTQAAKIQDYKKAVLCPKVKFTR